MASPTAVVFGGGLLLHFTDPLVKGVMYRVLNYILLHRPDYRAGRAHICVHSRELTENMRHQRATWSHHKVHAHALPPRVSSRSARKQTKMASGTQRNISFVSNVTFLLRVSPLSSSLSMWSPKKRSCLDAGGCVHEKLFHVRFHPGLHAIPQQQF